MEPLKTEAIGHITYGPHEPAAYMLSDDLLEATFGDKVYVRVGGQEASHPGSEYRHGYR